MHYDVIVIGAGSGNSIIDEEFAHLKVALIEQGLFGGTCLNVGCIPTKMFVYPADLALHATNGPRLGVHSRLDGVDWPEIRDRIFGRIDPIETAGRRYRLESPLVDVFEGSARFTGERELSIVSTDGSESVITGDHIVLAAGTRAAIPSIPGLDRVEIHTSDTIMRLEQLPGRLGIVGGGFIGSEFAHVFSAFGTTVTQVHRHAVLLNHHDLDIARRFTEEATRRWEVCLESSVTGVEPTSSGIEMLVRRVDGSTRMIEVDQLLFAIGRVPNTDRLAVARAGVELDPSGLVMVDPQQRSSVPGIWAMGDICDTPALKHVANHEARVVRHNLLHPTNLLASDHRFVPSAVFTHPQIASVGLTEMEAWAAGIDAVTAIHQYGDTAYGWAMEDDAHFVKLIGDRTSERLVGAHVIGPQASVLIQPLIQAMSFDQPITGLARGQYWIHPALTEVVENALLKLEERLVAPTEHSGATR
jgi:mycothione reductase